jgi:hypothetical protein
MELGAAVVREVAKLDAAPRSAVRWAAFRVTIIRVLGLNSC